MSDDNKKGDLPIIKTGNQNDSSNGDSGKQGNGPPPPPPNIESTRDDGHDE